MPASNLAKPRLATHVNASLLAVVAVLLMPCSGARAQTVITLPDDGPIADGTEISSLLGLGSVTVTVNPGGVIGNNVEVGSVLPIGNQGTLTVNGGTIGRSLVVNNIQTTITGGAIGAFADFRSGALSISGNPVFGPFLDVTDSITTISGGSFDETDFSGGTAEISGGTFSSVIQTVEFKGGVNALVTGGNFTGTFRNGGFGGPGTVTILGGEFTNGSAFSPMFTFEDGGTTTFGGSVILNSELVVDAGTVDFTGGTYKELVIIEGAGADSEVTGGSFLRGLSINAAEPSLRGGTFNGEVRIAGDGASPVIEGGEFSAGVTVESAEATVLGGSFTGQFRTLGENASVEITSGEFLGEVALDAGDITIQGGVFGVAGSPSTSRTLNLTSSSEVRVQGPAVFHDPVVVGAGASPEISDGVFNAEVRFRSGSSAAVTGGRFVGGITVEEDTALDMQNVEIGGESSIGGVAGADVAAITLESGVISDGASLSIDDDALLTLKSVRVGADAEFKSNLSGFVEFSGDSRIGSDATFADLVVTLAGTGTVGNGLQIDSFSDVTVKNGWTIGSTLTIGSEDGDSSIIQFTAEGANTRIGEDMLAESGSTVVLRSGVEVGANFIATGQGSLEVDSATIGSSFSVEGKRRVMLNNAFIGAQASISEQATATITDTEIGDSFQITAVSQDNSAAVTLIDSFVGDDFSVSRGNGSLSNVRVDVFGESEIGDNFQVFTGSVVNIGGETFIGDNARLGNFFETLPQSIEVDIRGSALIGSGLIVTGANVDFRDSVEVEGVTRVGGDSVVGVHGGVFNDGLSASGTSTVNVTDGVFRGAGSLQSSGGATINLYGGDLQNNEPEDNVQVITALVAEDNSKINVVGGSFNRVLQRDNAEIVFFGDIQRVVPDASAPARLLVGSLEDGSAVIVSNEDGDVVDFDSPFVIAPGPAAPDAPEDGVAQAEDTNKGQAGGTLTIRDGDDLRENLTVVNATVNIEGGVVAPNFEVANSQVSVTGGLVNEFEAYAGTTVDVTGGEVRGLEVYSGAEVTVRDGGVLSNQGFSGVPLVGALNGMSTNARLTVQDGAEVGLGSGNSLRARAGAIINIEGGEVGSGFEVGDPLLEDSPPESPNIRVDIFGGMVGNAMDINAGAVVTVSGGEVGDNADVNPGGQLILNDGEIGSGLDVFEGGELRVLGGTIGNSFEALAGASVEIFDGEISLRSDLFLRGGGVDDDTFELLPASTTTVSGGSLGTINAFDDASVTITGGSIEGLDVDPGTTELFGGDFGIVTTETTGGTLTVSRTPIGATESLELAEDQVVVGRFSDGSFFEFNSVGDRGGANGVALRLSGDLPDIDTTPIVADASNPAPSGLAPGQTLELLDGGSINGDFTALDAQVDVNGGQIEDDATLLGPVVNFFDGGFGDDVTLLGAQTSITGGETGSGFTVSGGSLEVNGGSIASGATFDFGVAVEIINGSIGANLTVGNEQPVAEQFVAPLAASRASAGGGANGLTRVNISGGVIGNGFDILGGVEVTISGDAVIGSSVEAFNGSVVNITGGEVGAGFDAESGSVVNISGGVVGTTFQAFAGSVVNITGGEVGDRFDAEDGSVVNISGNAIIGRTFEAQGASVVTITGGTFGDGFDAEGDSTVTISGGVFGNTFEARQNAVVHITGGTFGTGFNAFGNSVVTVSGDAVIGDNIDAGFNASQPVVFNISGGVVGNGFDANTGSTVTISGGFVGDGFDAFNGSVVSLSGGSVGGDFDASGGSVINLHVLEVALVGEFGVDLLTSEQLATLLAGELTIIDQRGGALLAGVLRDGSPFDFVLNANNLNGQDFFSATATLTVTQVPEPTALMLLSLTCIPLAARRRQPKFRT
ncbi:MAG: hypothetical protein AAGJ46_04475 [Planctomycetota bacterium]